MPGLPVNFKDTEGGKEYNRIRELEAKLARYQKALDSLTIAGGGSNMHGDPEYQAQWVQKRLDAQGELIKKKVYRIRELEAENAALKKAIEIDDCGREIIEAKNQEIAAKDAALEAAEAKLCWARNFLDAKDLNVPPDMLILRGNIVIGINEVITLIAKVLKTKKGKRKWK